MHRRSFAVMGQNNHTLYATVAIGNGGGSVSPDYLLESRCIINLIPFTNVNDISDGRVARQSHCPST